MIRFLLALALVTSTAGSDAPAFAPLPKLKHRIAAIAHRGGRALAPENTLAAFRKAIALGADYVEVDVRATRDGVLVLMHDRTVDRTTDGSGAIAEQDFAALRALDAGAKFGAEFRGERIPTFEETLVLCKGKIHIYVDHKEAPTEQVLAAIKKHGMERQVVIYNGMEGLCEWKRLAPKIPVMPSLPKAFRKPGGIAEFEQTLAAEVLDGNVLEWSQAQVDEAHAAGVKVYVDNLRPWDNPEGFGRALAMGVDGIQTDHPDQLMAFLKTPTGRKGERRGK